MFRANAKQSQPETVSMVQSYKTMARTSIKLIGILRQTARQLQTQAPYQWGHMGSCNCGHLAQVITSQNKGTIHAAAMQRHGDWAEQLRDYCPKSGLPMDVIIDQMLAVGLTQDDLSKLERLSDESIRSALPEARRNLNHNKRDDVVLYLTTWANLLEQQLLERISVQDIYELESMAGVSRR